MGEGRNPLRRWGRRKAPPCPMCPSPVRVGSRFRPRRFGVARVGRDPVTGPLNRPQGLEEWHRCRSDARHPPHRASLRQRQTVIRQEHTRQNTECGRRGGTSTGSTWPSTPGLRASTWRQRCAEMRDWSSRKALILADVPPAYRVEQQRAEGATGCQVALACAKLRMYSHRNDDGG